MSVHCLVSCLLCADLAGCAAPGGAANIPPADPAMTAYPVSGNQLDASVYRLGTGDTVRVDVLGEAELSLTALIDSAGSINYPFLGRVQAAGLTPRQLEKLVFQGLSSGYLKTPDVRVSVAQYRPVYVTGQVRQAGAYPFTLGLTVEKVLTLAGGVTQFASTRRIYVQHTGATQDQRVKVELDSPVLPGDTVVVEERMF
ncbi:MAG TPA: polysaccharide biosynthesis/export family protein [Solimonas sp.]|nr:polysaccharide biosynthesis/export family protein [Solimonas sp.]